MEIDGTNAFFDKVVDPSTGEVHDAEMLALEEKLDAINQLYEQLNFNSRKPSPSYDAIRERVKGSRSLSYEHWSFEEDELLRLEFEVGMSISTIAERHQRSYGAICSRLRKHELVDIPVTV